MIENLKFDDKGLIPAVLQDADTSKVLMVAYMNEEALKQTIETKKATFYSRSRQQLWVKGETSGNFMNVCQIRVDCDMDCLVVLVKPEGPACHTGKQSCFYRKIEDGSVKELTPEDEKSDIDIVSQVQTVVLDRKVNPKEGSYTNYLFDKGIDKILKKVGEENAETIIAAKNNSKEEIQYETADLIYHLTVMLIDRGLRWSDIYEELKKRR